MNLPQTASSPTLEIYRDSRQPVEARVADLLARMTLDEKLAQLGSIWVFQLLTNTTFDPSKAGQLMAHGIGQITRLAGASSLAPADAARLANTIQQYLLENTRLGIPAIIHEECISGYMARNATCFPQIIGLASTWEPELAQAMASVVRQQMRAAGAHQGLSPVLDVTRDPRWGRVEETFGEDPYLAAAMGVAFVRGLQGDTLRQGVIATGKHFVGYGAPEGGMNWAPVHLAPRELREVYLFPFEAAVKQAGLRAVMPAYHEIDGIPCSASAWLLTDLLRGEWGFNGLVVSDYFAIEELRRTHHLVSDDTAAAIEALQAGIDVELPNTRCYADPLRQAVQSGQINPALIDRSVARILRLKFELGLFENPYVDPNQTAALFDSPSQRRLARRIAQKSLVLLKNQGDLLPLARTVRSLAVIGPNAHSVRHLIGDYAYPCHIETLIEMRDQNSNVFNMPVPDDLEMVDSFVPIRSILDVLQEQLPNTDIHYAPGCAVTGDDTSGFEAAVEAARRADVVLVVLGGKSGLTDSCTCGEARDRADLNLPGVQEALLRAVHAVGKPVVLVLVNGRPLSVNWAAENIPAILEAWLPGEEGAAAVVEALLGDINPGGKLPITVPRSAGQIPIYYGHKPSGGRSHWKGDYVDQSSQPLWPFGYGLSYTTFRLSDLQVSPTTACAGDRITVRLQVTNTGPRPGDEVVQLYTTDPVASVTRPVKELKGFKRVTLNPGETKTVTFELAVEQLAFYNRRMEYVLEPGDIRLWVGTSSADLPLHTDIRLEGDPVVVTEKRFFSQVTVS